MKYIIISLLLLGVSFSCFSGSYKNKYIQYDQVVLTPQEKQIVKESVDKRHNNYDAKGKMLTKEISAWNYHTDAMSGVFHEVRASFSYAVALLDLDDENYKERAFDIIEKTISLQDTDPNSPSCGVWPYYQEEPLATKKSPIDYNWADFNAVSLLDVYMGHKDRIPAELMPKLEKAIVLAARSIQKRNMGPGYTNIAIMGTYVTYLTSHLFDLPDMQEYAKKRLQNFYNYTLEKGGFSEYNSPTYTIVALDELDRMKRHIVEPDSKIIIDSLYTIAWEMIAKHYHKPTAQWAGPHSRSYRTLVANSFYGILNQGSAGKIDLGYKTDRSDVKIKHQIPVDLYPYFLSPQYPREEKDVFESNEPQITGTSYLTKEYALSSVSRSSMWNQRRPFLVYWGTAEKPSYLQPRLLHEFYDFSTAAFFSEQKENKVIAAINLGTNGGDKHINIDRLTDGKFKAKDLRLRFELGNYEQVNNLKLPKAPNAPLILNLDNLQFNLQLYYGEFDKYKGYWEKGSDGTNSWVDYVFYSGPEIEFDLNTINNAAFGFVFYICGENEKTTYEKAEFSVKEGILNASWSGLKVSVPVKPAPCPKNL